MSEAADVVALHDAGADFFGLADRKFENRPAILLDVVKALIDGLVRRRAQAPAGWHAQSGPATPINLVLEVDDAEPILRRRAHDNCARAISEQHTRGPIGVVDDAGHHIGAHGQRVRVCAGGDHVHGRRERIRKPGARRAQIEAPRSVRADLVLEQARGARKHHVGRRRADDDEVDIVRSEPGLRDRFQRRFLREVRRPDPWIDDVTLANSGSLKNPFVRRVDELFKILIREKTGWNVGRESADLRTTKTGSAQNKPLPGAVNPK